MQRALFFSLTLLTPGLTLNAQRLMPIGNDGPDFRVYSMTEFNDELIIGGQFTEFNGDPVGRLVAWDGQGPATQIGTLWSLPPDNVQDLLVHQNELIIAYVASGYDGVAKWDGMTWTDLGNEFGQRVMSLAEYNGELYAGGRFNWIGTDSIRYVAKWDGQAWVPVGEGFDDEVESLVVYNGELYAGGDFWMSGQDSVRNIARWDGAQWVQVGPGLEDGVQDLREVNGELWMVGSFEATADLATPLPSSAVWDGTAFQPLSQISLSGTDRKVLNSAVTGPILSSSLRGIDDVLDGGGKEAKWSWITCMQEHDGVTYAGGRYAHDSYEGHSFFGKFLPGEDCHELSIGGFSATIHALGDLNDPYAGEAGLEVPAGSGRHSVYYTGLAAVANGSAGLFATATQYPDVNDLDHLKAGPWADAVDITYQEHYHQVWPLDKGLVWDHASQWSFPGYQATYPIAAWPGNGDPANGEPLTLAPFEDPNSDNGYAPQQGEVPLFPGDAAVYTIRSDMRQDGQPVGLDVHTFHHGLDVAPGDPLHQVLLVEHRLVNRSSLTHDTLWVSDLVDMEIGNSSDDFIGCDTTRNLAYGYNSDAMDEDAGGVLGYGAAPPAMGVVSLDAPMYAVMPWGESSSTPVTPLEYHHLANGRYTDGSPVLDPDLNETRYSYYGTPSTPSEWSELSSGNPGGDRRVFVTYGPWFDVAPGDTICLDLAYVFAWDTTGTNLSNVDLLRQRTDLVQQWYDQQAGACGEYVALGMPGNDPLPLDFTMYPNPSMGQVRVEWLHGQVSSIQVVGLDGRLVHEVRTVAGGNTSLIDLGHLASGLYQVRIVGGGQVGVRPLVLTR